MKKQISILLFLISFIAHAQVKDTLNVAVFTYDGVELLDFAGPA